MSSLSSFIQLRTFTQVKCRPQVALASSSEAASFDQSASQRRAVKIPPVSAMATSSQRVHHGTECQNGATHAQPMASSAQAGSASPQTVADMDDVAASENFHIATATVHAGTNSDANQADSFVNPVTYPVLRVQSDSCAPVACQGNAVAGRE